MDWGVVSSVPGLCLQQTVAVRRTPGYVLSGCMHEGEHHSIVMLLPNVYL